MTNDTWDDTRKKSMKEEMKRELPPDTLRRTGRTTRQADEIIQELFERETTFFWDHAHTKGNMANRNLTDVVLSRLKNEHPHRNANYYNFGDLIGITIKGFSKNEDAIKYLKKVWNGIKDGKKS